MVEFVLKIRRLNLALVTNVYYLLAVGAVSANAKVQH